MIKIFFLQLKPYRYPIYRVGTEIMRLSKILFCYWIPYYFCSTLYNKKCIKIIKKGIITQNIEKNDKKGEKTDVDYKESRRELRKQEQKQKQNKNGENIKNIYKKKLIMRSKSINEGWETFGLLNHQVQPFTASLKDQLKLCTSTLESEAPMLSCKRQSKKILKRLSLAKLSLVCHKARTMGLSMRIKLFNNILLA